jgi:biotin carboxyl carrier protein
MRHLFRLGNQCFAVEAERVHGNRYRIAVGSETIELEVAASGEGHLRLYPDEGPTVATVSRQRREVFVTLLGRDYHFQLETHPVRRATLHEHPDSEVTLPMPGVVVQVFVTEGESVAEGQPLLIVEAMKMEHTLTAPRQGTVHRLSAEVGKMIEAGAVLLEVREGSTGPEQSI